jgi:ribonuclease HI
MIYDIYTDGATRPQNPGPSGYAFAVYNKGQEVTTGCGYLGSKLSNNQAEYMAVIAALRWVMDNVTGGLVTIYSDSKLVLSQVTRQWKISARHLRTLCQEVWDIEAKLKVVVKYQHVRGHKGIVGNERADELAGYAVDKRILAEDALIQIVATEREHCERKRGHEKLEELMTDWLMKRGHLVHPWGAGYTPVLKNQLISSQNTRWLHMPNLLTVVSRREAIALKLVTSFHFTKATQPALRTIPQESYETCKGLADIGFKVFVVYKPHGGGNWKKWKDMNWEDKSSDIPAMCASIDDIEFVPALLGDQNSGIMNASWSPFITFVKAVEKAYPTR